VEKSILSGEVVRLLSFSPQANSRRSFFAPLARTQPNRKYECPCFSSSGNRRFSRLFLSGMLFLSLLRGSTIFPLSCRRMMAREPRFAERSLDCNALFVSALQPFDSFFSLRDSYQGSDFGEILRSSQTFRGRSCFCGAQIIFNHLNGPLSFVPDSCNFMARSHIAPSFFPFFSVQTSPSLFKADRPPKRKPRAFLRCVVAIARLTRR